MSVYSEDYESSSQSERKEITADGKTISTNEDIEMNVENSREENLESQVKDIDNTMGLVRTYFDKKFESLKREISDDVTKASKRRKTTDSVDFKYKSNKMQYNFKSELIEDLHGVVELVNSGSITRSVKKLKNAISDIKKRNKLIRMADRSVAGWRTVEEYKPDDLADNSDDEKKIRTAETRAISKMKKQQPSRQGRSFNQNYSASTFTFRPQNQHPPGRPIYSGQNNQINNQFNYQKRQPKPTDICLACGQQGHWRTSCPNFQSRAKPSGK